MEKIQCSNMSLKSEDLSYNKYANFYTFSVFFEEYFFKSENKDITTLRILKCSTSLISYHKCIKLHVYKNRSL